MTSRLPPLRDAPLAASRCCVQRPFGGTALAATPAVWTADIPEVAKWHKVTVGTGAMLVGAAGSLSAVDAQTGKVIWTRSDIKKTAPFSAREIVGTPYLLVDNNDGIMPPHDDGADEPAGREHGRRQDGLVMTPFQGYSVGTYPVPQKNLAVVFSFSYIEGKGRRVDRLPAHRRQQLWQTLYRRNVVQHPADNWGVFSPKMDMRPTGADRRRRRHARAVRRHDALDLGTGAIRWDVEFKSAHPSMKLAYARRRSTATRCWPVARASCPRARQTPAPSSGRASIFPHTIAQMLVARPTPCTRGSAATSRSGSSTSPSAWSRSTAPTACCAGPTPARRTASRT